MPGWSDADARPSKTRRRRTRVNLPSGLSPSVVEFHHIGRPLDVVGSRTVTAGSELHRPRNTRELLYSSGLFCHWFPRAAGLISVVRNTESAVHNRTPRRA